MAEEELSAPLAGHSSRRRRPSRWPAAMPRIAAGLLGLALAVFAGWAMVVEDPYGGEPIAVASANASGTGGPEQGASAGGRVYQGPEQAQPDAPPKAGLPKARLPKS